VSGRVQAWRSVTLRIVAASDVTTIRAEEPSDAAGIAAIYNHYVEQTIVTFEEKPVSDAEMARRIEDVRSESLPWLVAEEAGRLVGYASSRKWKSRSAYRFSAEITVYVEPGHARRGIGSKLYARLLPILQTRGIHAVIGGIALVADGRAADGDRAAARFRDPGRIAQVGRVRLSVPGSATAIA
jgi:L-amino acid N-acyltransferase YncA